MSRDDGRVTLALAGAEGFEQASAELAQRLLLPLQAPDRPLAELLLCLDEQGLSLRSTEADVPGAAATGAVRVDFVGGALAHRRQFGGGAGQMVARAVGIRGAVRPSILDATAGLGREIASRMRLIHCDAISALCDWSEAIPQVIHLDPMFPHREKSALVKKEMRLFRPLAGDDNDAPALLRAALALASHRVAVKRPRKAPAIAGPAPSAEMKGQSSRYDIYGKKRLE